jgi:hypothetical protein
VLPVPGVSTERRGLFQVLAALPDGRLAAWGADPRAGVPTFTTMPQSATAFWLWLWDPVTRQWQVIPTPLPTTEEEGCGQCWYGQSAMDRTGETYLYVSHFGSVQVNPSLGLFRIRVTRRP